MELGHVAVRSGKVLTFLRRELRLSSTTVGKLKKSGQIFVNDQAVFANFMVSSGDVISVKILEDYPDFPPESMDLSILYEDEALLILDKPPGILMHPTANRQVGTLANGVVDYYQKTGQVCGFHPVSRLDRDTFGVVLVAKNGHIHSLMTQKCKKIYRATVWGVPLAKQGDITVGIGRKSGSLFRKLDDMGQFAHTKFKVLEQGAVQSILELTPVTGRTHQLRLHCHALGHPIVGEPFYTCFPRKQGENQALLAYEIGFIHPVTGEEMTVQSRQTLP